MLEQNVRKLELEKQKEEARLKFIEDQEQRTQYYYERKMKDLVFKQNLDKENKEKEELIRKKLMQT